MAKKTIKIQDEVLKVGDFVPLVYDGVEADIRVTVAKILRIDERYGFGSYIYADVLGRSKFAKVMWNGSFYIPTKGVDKMEFLKRLKRLRKLLKRRHRSIERCFTESLLIYPTTDVLEEV